jgi:hypothetical protein
MSTKKEITELVSQLKPTHWVLLELQSGLKKRGKFLMSDKDHLYINEQRTMATGAMYEGKAGQVPQMIRSKIMLSELATLVKLPGVGGASGSKASKKR